MWNGFFPVLSVLLNFFFLDRDPVKCARYHGDKHLNKMQLESAQIASFVWHVNVFDGLSGAVDGQDEKFGDIKANIYKRSRSHIHHPVVKWACQSPQHYLAICDLGIGKGALRAP
jgi:hypothetical protein